MQENLIAEIEALGPRLKALFETIAANTGDKPGITRAAFGSSETAAAESISEFARSEGLKSSFNRVGNLEIVDDRQADLQDEIIIGSHIDSVPHGGNYDGLAGVIAGLAVLAAFRRTNTQTKFRIKTIGFRCEESPWFGPAYIGSKLQLGLLKRGDLDILTRFDTGQTLASHLGAIGVIVDDSIAQPVSSLSGIRAYLELHIEQASLLETEKVPVGIATAVRGNIRFPFARCIGSHAHSGAVPRHLRRDAVLATAKLLAHADFVWSELIENGNQDLVFTCGIFQTNPHEHAMTKVPGEVNFSLNIGGTDDAVMEYLYSSIAKRADELQVEHGVEFRFGDRVGTSAVKLDMHLQQAATEAARDLNLTTRSMPTVGHDAAMYSKQGIPSSVLLMRNSNGSHNPDEHLEMSDFVMGLKILAETVLTI
ncbi:hydantoinase/carbamoylase family amidase [Bradyrhizobium canariense]|uniref:N-carbamoyl-L-amino-acid hydrolase n=1 Tax=Bradyrhizobium canariense TaxID=255045 RepID=A0A1H1YQJ4_9BRAD|nr:hydantoinase/carbamoylase family amidase [Bradyrhizobium canariense]SDT23620.1 N-carbamoyl-L-amino-acid hydrolase [Bradyrhizobium canariense]